MTFKDSRGIKTKGKVWIFLESQSKNPLHKRHYEDNLKLDCGAGIAWDKGIIFDFAECDHCSDIRKCPLFYKDEYWTVKGEIVHCLEFALKY